MVIGSLEEQPRTVRLPPPRRPGDAVGYRAPAARRPDQAESRTKPRTKPRPEPRTEPENEPRTLRSDLARLKARTAAKRAVARPLLRTIGTALVAALTAGPVSAATTYLTEQVVSLHDQIHQRIGINLPGLPQPGDITPPGPNGAGHGPVASIVSSLTNPGSVPIVPDISGIAGIAGTSAGTGH